eukprot:s2769_g9.t1
MQDMHVLYAHQCTRTFRLESITPDDVWDAAMKNLDYRVRVYDAASASVRDRPLKELVGNRELYRNRGWCKAEVEWSSARSRSEQNHRIDAPWSRPPRDGPGKVPMSPEVFEEMSSAAFTHRSDAAVNRLQRTVFIWKVSACEEALFQDLPKGQLGQLAKALPYYQKLRVLRLRKFEVGREEAEKFGKALASNETVSELEIGPVMGASCVLCEAIAGVLKTNATLTHIDLRLGKIGSEGVKAIGEALKINSTLTSIDLKDNHIGDAGGKAIGEASKTNSTLISIHLSRNRIGLEGGKAIAKALKTNSTLRCINLEGNAMEWEGEEAIAEALQTNATLTHMNFRGNLIRDQASTNMFKTKRNSTHSEEGVKALTAIADALKRNSALTHLSPFCARVFRDIWHSRTLAPTSQATTAAMAAEPVQACTGRVRIQELAEQLTVHCTITALDIRDCCLHNEGGQAIAEALSCNSTLTQIHLEGGDVGEEGGKAIAEALKTNSTLTKIDLGANKIGVEGGKVLAEALKSNSTLTDINLHSNDIGVEGGKAFANMLKTNSTLTRINLRWNNVGDEGGKALAQAVSSSSNVCEIELYGNNIGASCQKALEGALRAFEPCGRSPPFPSTLTSTVTRSFRLQLPGGGLRKDTARACPTQLEEDPLCPVCTHWLGKSPRRRQKVLATGDEVMHKVVNITSKHTWVLAARRMRFSENFHRS